MSKILVVANWKMNPSNLAEARHLYRLIKKLKNLEKKIEIVVCPPFVYILAMKQGNNGIMKLGSQDCFWEQKGAFTGEISTQMLKDLGCKYVIVGHSERRKYFGETDEMARKKIKAVLDADLSPILCIGEMKEERYRGETSLILRRQIEEGLQGIFKKQLKNLIIAYEPVWAIGTGNACQPDEAMTAGLFIRKILVKLAGRKTANGIRILYGGSVNSENARDYIKNAGFQGLLIGGASLDPREFMKIVRNI